MDKPSTKKLGEFLQDLASTVPTGKELYFGPVDFSRLNFDPNDSDANVSWSLNYEHIIREVEKRTTTVYRDNTLHLTILIASNSQSIWTVSGKGVNLYKLHHPMRSARSRLSMRSAGCPLLYVNKVNKGIITRQLLEIEIFELFEYNVMEANGFDTNFTLYKLSKLDDEQKHSDEPKNKKHSDEPKNKKQKKEEEKSVEEESESDDASEAEHSEEYIDPIKSVKIVKKTEFIQEKESEEESDDSESDDSEKNIDPTKIMKTSVTSSSA